MRYTLSKAVTMILLLSAITPVWAGNEMILVGSDPALNHAQNVPLNHELTLIFSHQIHNGAPVITITDQSGQPVAVTQSYHSSWNGRSQYSTELPTEVTEYSVKPASGQWSAGTEYQVWVNGQLQGRFQAGKLQRGQLISLEPVKGHFPPLQDSAEYSLDEMNQMEDILLEAIVHSKHTDVLSAQSQLSDDTFIAGLQLFGLMSQHSELQPGKPGNHHSGVIPRKLAKWLVEKGLPHFIEKNARTGVRLYKALYQSVDPLGNSSQLSGLVVGPQGPYAQGIVILLHATLKDNESAPSSPELHMLMALRYASLGYVVVAPDNYGRGISGVTKYPEPYLMRRPVAEGVYDMLQSARSIYDINDDMPLLLVGASQGAGSAVTTLYYLNNAGLPASLIAADGPYGLENITRSYMAMVAGTAEKDDPYLQYVRQNPELLPGYLRKVLEVSNAYQRTHLDMDSVFDKDKHGNLQVKAQFAKNYLEGRENALAAYLGNNTLFNLQPHEINSHSVVLYHMPQDALLPAQGTADLLAEWKSDVAKRGDCRLTDKITILAMGFAHTYPMVTHVLCPLYMLDDVAGKLSQ